MKCVLHIGTEKTGTTSIQHGFSRNEQQLKAQGFHYCRSLGRPNNRHIATSAMRLDRYDTSHQLLDLTERECRLRFIDEIRRAFAEEVRSLPSSVHTFVISSEHCASRLINREEVAWVEDLLRADFEDICILVYLRPQIEVEISSFSTAVRSSQHRPELVRSAPGATPVSFDYADLLTRWEAMVGRKHMIVRNFQDASDVFVDMCATLGIDMSDFENVERYNTALSARSAHFLNNLNLHLPRFIGHKMNPLRGDIVRALADRPFNGALLVSRNEALRFQKSFEISNEAVRKRYFRDRKTLFSIDFADFPDQEGSATIEQEEAFEVFSELWKREKTRQIKLEGRIAGLQAGHLRLESRIAHLEARLLDQQGDVETAFQKFRTALDMVPDNFAALSDAARFCARRGMRAEAKDFCSRGLQLRPAAPGLVRLQELLDS